MMAARHTRITTATISGLDTTGRRALGARPAVDTGFTADSARPCVPAPPGTRAAPEAAVAPATSAGSGVSDRGFELTAGAGAGGGGAGRGRGASGRASREP